MSILWRLVSSCLYMSDMWLCSATKRRSPTTIFWLYYQQVPYLEGYRQYSSFFLIPKNDPNFAKNFPTHCGPFSVSKCDGDLYGMTQRSRNMVILLGALVFTLGLPIVSFSNLFQITGTSWFPLVAFRSDPSMSVAPNSGGSSGGSNCIFRWFLVCAES